MTTPERTAEETIYELQQLLLELLDPDPCDYDHHGCCQAHSLSPRPCPHERAKELLKGVPRVRRDP